MRTQVRIPRLVAGALCGTIDSFFCVCCFSFCMTLVFCVVCCFSHEWFYSFVFGNRCTVAATGMGAGSGAASTDSYQSPDDKAGVGSVDF